MKIVYTFIYVFSLFCVPYVLKGQVYTEQYRPQFHFSPKSGWIGDPDGTIRFNDLYHLFWWGHAVSEDLVYWTEYPWPMLGGSSIFDYYTGSVVVDTANTAGFGQVGDTVAVAIYTMHNKSTNIETQGISVSKEPNFKYFNFYNNNPVIPSTSTDFRDPSVFWDSQLNRWAMAITRPGEHRIEIYSSPDLKTWTKQSSFGPLGARAGGWEVPDLFQLPLDGNPNNKKWVMICGMGPNRGQYWIGDFDGNTFTPDATTLAYLKDGAGISGVQYENFESTEYANWTIEGTAFGSAPANGTLNGQQEVSGFLGSYLVNSFNGGDASKGKLTSNQFTITKPFINFLISGGNHNNLTCINLLINGQIVRTATGDNSELLKWFGWDVTEYIGQSAVLQIIDNFSGSWGHINIDQIMFSDILTDQREEHAYWIDYGPDFYAVRTYRNYDTDNNRTVWLGWMNNWDYANSIPTTWGGSTAESLPREIELVSTNQGYKIRQKPIPELQKLRKMEVSIAGKTVEGTVGLSEFVPQKNTYEFEAVFELTPGTNQKVGFNLCVSATNKMVLGYDAKTSNVFIDRTKSGYVNFNSKFPRIIKAPIRLMENKIKFHVFVDQLSLEVFINDGEMVLTTLMFPNPYFQKGIELFSENSSSVLETFKAWELKSIWLEDPSTGVLDRNLNNREQMFVYPNPANDKLFITQDSESILPVNVTVVTLLGKIVKEEKFYANDRPYSLDISNLNAGLYVLCLTNEKYISTQRFIKVNP